MIRIRAEAARILLFFALMAALLSVLAALTACDWAEANANNEANSAFDQGDFDQALAEYERISEERPERPEPDYNAANSLYRKDDYEQAEQELKEALLDAEEADDEELIAKARFNLGNVLYQMEEYEGAIEEYEEVLRQNPNDREAEHNLELAQSKLQEQQQQEQEQQQQQQDQQQGEGDQPGSPDQPDEEGDEEQEGPDGDREGVGEDPEGEQRGDGSEQDSQELERPGANPQQQEMTPGQALQFLEAVGQNTDTLQSYLQRQFAPSSPVERDW